MLLITVPPAVRRARGPRTGRGANKAPQMGANESAREPAAFQSVAADSPPPVRLVYKSTLGARVVRRDQFGAGRGSMGAKWSPPPLEPARFRLTSLEAVDKVALSSLSLRRSAGPRPSRPSLIHRHSDRHRPSRAGRVPELSPNVSPLPDSLPQLSQIRPPSN